MKIRVTYSESELDKKFQHEAAVKRLFPDTKVRETAPKDGFMHTVLTVPIEHKPTKQAVFVDDTPPCIWYP